MHWIAASLISAFFLGCYDLCTKHAVRENAVLPVLFFSNVVSAVVWLSLMSVRGLAPASLPEILAVAPLDFTQHLQLLLKSTIVSASWVCTYFAVKHLPVSLAAPVRATTPMWTLIAAMLVLGERPSWLEGVGIAITLGSFIALSFVGAREGVHFHRDKWIWFLLGGTVLGAVSGLYDKFLLAHAGFTVATVQSWFSIYLALLFLPLAVGWKFRWWPRNEFHWRWSIVFIAFALLVSDFVYFSALREPGAMISLVASLRRGSLLVAFAGGIFFFGEKNPRQKLPAVIGVLIGIVITVLG